MKVLSTYWFKKAPEDGAVLAFYDDIGCYPNSELATFIVENKVILICPWNYDEKKEEKKIVEDE